MRCRALRSTSETGKYWETRNMMNQMDNLRIIDTKIDKPKAPSQTEKVKKKKI